MNIGSSKSLSQILNAKPGDTVSYNGIVYTLLQGIDKHFKEWSGGVRGGQIDMGAAHTEGYFFKHNSRWHKTFEDAAIKAQSYQLQKYTKAQEFVRDWNR